MRWRIWDRNFSCISKNFSFFESITSEKNNFVFRIACLIYFVEIIEFCSRKKKYLWKEFTFSDTTIIHMWEIPVMCLCSSVMLLWILRMNILKHKQLLLLPQNINEFIKRNLEKKNWNTILCLRLTITISYKIIGLRLYSVK